MNIDAATKAAFAPMLFRAAQAASSKPSVATAVLIAAHGAYESGWGTAMAAKGGNNYWNLSAGSMWFGPVVMGADVEYTPGSNVAVPITQKFRKFADAPSAVVNYLSFLSAPRYADGLRKLLAGDPTFVVDLGINKYGPDGKSIVSAWSGGLIKGGFYTLPIERYSTEFKAVLVDTQAALGVSL